VGRGEIPVAGRKCYATYQMMKSPETVDVHSEAFLHRLVARQLRLSLGCAAAFGLVLLGLPLANYFFPEAMATRVLGFTLSWLILGLGMFPVVWTIAFYFIRTSMALEERVVVEAKGEPEAAEAEAPPSLVVAELQKTT
jgi:hypothetical protein